MTGFFFPPVRMPDGIDGLRAEVRAFLAEALAEMPAEKRAQTWDGFDPDFSRAVGARGWIGMTWPKEYGGGGRSALERYVVIEEMLAAGAPVSAHWFADRQSGPLILRHGSEAQRRDLLPRIARGELCFAVGLSEPGAGSDVASVRCAARREGDEWIVNGQKVWTTNAHRAQYMIALVRTEPGSQRHAGLSQLLIDLSLPGIDVRPIRDIAGREHFNEVFFTDLRLPATALIGREGEGWAQVMSELAHERSGPERFLSTFRLLVALAKSADPGDARVAEAIGGMIAALTTLRALSLSIAGMLAQGQDLALEAALVKDLGVGFEQAMVERVYELAGIEPDLGGDELARVQAALLALAPSFSIRGGTREVLRGIIARGLGLR